jgi:Tol biopolymer transport system component
MKMLIGIVSLAALALTAYAAPPAAAVASEVAFQQGVGSRIAFTRLRQNVETPGSDFRFDAEIWIMNGDGGEPTRLTCNTTDDLAAVWSPDGRTIAFHGAQWAKNEKGQLVPGFPFLFLIDVESAVQTPLLTDQGEPVRGRFPSWSPDGEKIAFDTGGQNPNIFVINPDGTGLEQLTHGVATNVRPDWSPDGRTIAFASSPTGKAQIFVMNADGSDAVPLTGLGNNAPDWSPNGQQIVFQSTRDFNSEIYVMNADGSEQRNLTNNPAGQDADADWSPDGRMIAFQRDTQPGQINQLFVVSADGGETIALTARPSANGHPAWSRGRAVRPKTEGVPCF